MAPRPARHATPTPADEVWRLLQVHRLSDDELGPGVAVRHVLQVGSGRDRALTRVAAAQCSLVHRRQVLAAGIGRGAIAHRLATGMLYPLLPRVYGLGGSALPPLAMEMAALLWAERDAVVSHDSAAALWGLTAGPSWTLGSEGRITVVGRHLSSAPGVVVHRVARLDPRDVRIHRGIPVTAPARTMLDFTGLDPGPGLLSRALAELRVRGLAEDYELRRAIARAPRRRGGAALARLMAGGLGTGVTRSEAERRLLGLLERARLPRPVTNVRLHGLEVDLLWSGAGLIVEVDGYRFHGHRAAFERDRRRDQTLAAAGFRVMRVTWRQIVREPLATTARIAEALATGGG